MDWDQAQRRSVTHWRGILDGIGRRDALAIVHELSQLGALCEMAREEAGGAVDRCRYCLVFADARQCADTRLNISALVLNGELDEARAATMAVVERIADADPPRLH